MVTRRREEVAGFERRIDAAVASRLYDQAGAARWSVPPEVFAAALERSVAHGLPRATTRSDAPALRASDGTERYLGALHLEDLALTCACMAGSDAAWEHFILEHRPALYRAAAAIDRTGGGRELADSLYADLFGLRERDGERQSLFLYFHGRSSVSSWLRAVLAQRHIDRIRAARRLDPLPDDDAPGAMAAAPIAADRGTNTHVAAMGAALQSAVASLAPSDRLRLGCYYAQNMKLAAIGRMLGEHEATVSRHLTRTRQQLRASIEDHLREVAGYDDAAVMECFRAVAGDSGGIDLAVMLGTGGVGKNPALDRS